MAGTERLSNIGYMGLAVETTKGVAVTPTDYIPLYEESLTTAANFVEQQPIFGNKFATYTTLQGIRSHTGSLTLMAEPNTTARLMDMLFTKQSSQVIYTFTVTSANATAGATYTNNSQTFTVVTSITASTTLVMTGTGAPAASGTLTKASGSGDASITFSTASAGATNHSFILSNTQNPKSYTIDISTGSVIKRFMGVEASKYNPNWNENELQHQLSVSALASFQSGLVASVTGSGPYTVALDTTYDSNPTRGLVVGDLIRFYDVSANTFIDATIATVSTASFTTATAPTLIAAGDFVYLRPATPSYNVLPTFLWAKTEFRFGATAAAAISAAQVRVEQGSAFELMHNFDDDNGAQRSGGFDPAALLRTTGDATLTVKKFFDTPDDAAPFFQLTKQALVVRHFAGATNQYEFRVTFNNIKTDTPFPNIKQGEINFSEITFHPNYDPTDSKAIQIDVIDALTSI